MLVGFSLSINAKLINARKAVGRQETCIGCHMSCDTNVTTSRNIFNLTTLCKDSMTHSILIVQLAFTERLSHARSIKRLNVLTSWQPLHSRILPDHCAFSDVPLPFPAIYRLWLRSCNHARRTPCQLHFASVSLAANYSDWMHRRNSSARIDGTLAQLISDVIAIFRRYLWVDRRPAMVWNNDIHSL